MIDEAALLARSPSGCHDVLFLDVYTSSEKAIKVYADCDFRQVTDQPIPDPQVVGKTYIIMARRVSIAQT